MAGRESGSRLRCVHQTRQLLDRRKPPSFTTANFFVVTARKRDKPGSTIVKVDVAVSVYVPRRLLPDTPGLFIEDGSAVKLAQHVKSALTVDLLVPRRPRVGKRRCGKYDKSSYN